MFKFYVESDEVILIQMLPVLLTIMRHVFSPPFKKIIRIPVMHAFKIKRLKKSSANPPKPLALTCCMFDLKV